MGGTDSATFKVQSFYDARYATDEANLFLDMYALLFQADAQLPHVTAPHVLIAEEDLYVVSTDAFLGDLYMVRSAGSVSFHNVSCDNIPYLPQSNLRSVL